MSPPSSGGVQRDRADAGRIRHRPYGPIAAPRLRCAQMGAQLRVAEELGSLSLATDLGSGVPFEKGLRTAVVASRLAEAAGVGQADRRATYYAALLRSLGCTATSTEFSAMFDDDVA